MPLLDKSVTSWRTDLLNEHWNGQIPDFAQVRGLFAKPGKPLHTWKYVELATSERELYNEEKDQFELGNVAGAPANASLIGIMADRLRELDPGWPAGASVRQPGSAPDENTDDDPE